MAIKGQILEGNEDLEKVYAGVCRAVPENCTVMQNAPRVERYGELSHSSVERFA